CLAPRDPVPWSDAAKRAPTAQLFLDTPLWRRLQPVANRSIWYVRSAVQGEGGWLMRGLARIAVVFACTVLAPAAALAQATITGTVKDASGAVLPGATVEAASPALIEKVRSATTDSAGLYRIVDLRPGVYTLTVSLPGFATIVRDGIDVI